jgi:mannose-6-phosphate isomerase-like protein (cupin superfamily)
MKGFVINIDEETEINTDYRRVLYTARNSQLVVMHLEPSDEIGAEIHELDQFIRFEEGEGLVILNGEEYAVSDGFAVVIPAGVEHNVINTGSEPLKLYSVYAPPEHKDGTVHKTKADDAEEHFDGVTTE